MSWSKAAMVSYPGFVTSVFPDLVQKWRGDMFCGRSLKAEREKGRRRGGKRL